jgi:DNA helicase-2/ATP-dependent DNA helicase PcrA
MDLVLLEQLATFRLLVLRWQGSVLLPIDQVILTLSQDLFLEPTELALAHKLAVLLRRASQQNPSWRLPELTEELIIIAKNQRRFWFNDDTGFDPQNTRSHLHHAQSQSWNGIVT